MMQYPKDVEAEITFLTTEEGGRRGPAYSGYRPQFHYDGHDWDAIQHYGDVEAVEPGQTVIAYLSFLSPKEHVGKLYPGKEFLIREGHRVVARGCITKILDLEASAHRL
jgi:elongation factor Tu